MMRYETPEVKMMLNLSDAIMASPDQIPTEGYFEENHENVVGGDKGWHDLF